MAVPTGTAANLISMMLMAEGHGNAVVVGDKSHVVYWERGSMSSCGGIFCY